ncbi:hypothetical protein L3Q82_003283 [Scortum barcoo]|uniref:Uncharacterized protein n=1 Tax=Scortum barcoo TaxID=214431 RepID=A0ACB8VS33_9TELE|nr:hypothetical protein L3Q82_003283 [Scortum barcoo]
MPPRETTRPHPGGAVSDAGMVLQQAPTEHREEDVTMMKGTSKANLANIRSQSEPSSQHQPGATMPDRASPGTSAPANLEQSISGPYTDSPPRQRTLTPILPAPTPSSNLLMTRPSIGLINRRLRDGLQRGGQSPDILVPGQQPPSQRQQN